MGECIELWSPCVCTETSFAQSTSYRPYSSDYLTQDESRHPSTSSTSFEYLDNSHAEVPTTSSDDTQEDYPDQTFTNLVGTSSEGGLPQNMQFSARELLSLTSSAGLNAPSPLGLPMYSASGFDLLSIFARVATRPHPQIVLGPVDLTCSFVVVDVRRYDRPIVYASPSFCELTGYPEHEVLGKNCRFLQAPNGDVKRGDERRFVSPETVQHLYKSVVADKECQASIINYRKNGQAFINLVTVIPVLGGVLNRPEEADEVVYQVGFQVDLTRQPDAILQKLRDGSYIVNYGAGTPVAPSSLAPPLRDRRFTSNAISKDLRSLLADPSFLKSIPMNKPKMASSSAQKADSSLEGSKLLNLLLLESTPDFIHVLSLKGSFLYVAPSVRRVLGFDPDELVGKSIADYCHPADLVPLMRELKESSVMPGVVHDEGPPTVQAGPGPPKTVDLLFRAQSKSNGYVWVESRGRLHVEPGKGRKAIILSGRVRSLPSMEWGAITRAGGLVPTVRDHKRTKPDGTPKDTECEFWGMVNLQGTFLAVGAGIRDVLGWGPGEVIGKRLLSFVVDNRKQVLEEQLAQIQEGDHSTQVVCEMGEKEGGRVRVQIVLYRDQGSNTSASPIIFQIKSLDSSSPPTSHTSTHPCHTNVFEELETSRDSSWQYELQQLKFANRRLTEEAEKLESALVLHDQQTKPFADQNTPTSRHTSQDWASTYMRGYHQPLRPLKRAWDLDAAPSS